MQVDKLLKVHSPLEASSPLGPERVFSCSLPSNRYRVPNETPPSMYQSYVYFVCC